MKKCSRYYSVRDWGGIRDEEYDEKRTRIGERGKGVYLKCGVRCWVEEIWEGEMKVTDISFESRLNKVQDFHLSYPPFLMEHQPLKWLIYSIRRSCGWYQNILLKPFTDIHRPAMTLSSVCAHDCWLSNYVINAIG